MVNAREIPDSDDLWARVAWSTTATPGDRIVWQAIETWGATRSLHEMWAGRDPARIRHLARALDISPREVLGFRDRYPTPPQKSRVAEVRDRTRQLGVSLLSPGGVDWPERLLDLGPHQPVVMFSRGGVDVFSSSPTLGVVGSRSPSSEGRQLCRQFSTEAIAYGYTLISGGARGIDAEAHDTADRLDGPQVMVLATALDRLGSWQPEMVERVARRGAIVTETPPGQKITPASFLHRNRVIAALSDRVVVVEAAERSGSLNTASHAKTLGRDLSAVISRPLDDTNAGCYRLLEEWGADRYDGRSMSRSARHVTW